MAAAPLLTRLFPNKITPKSLSVDFKSFCVVTAARFLFFASCLSLYLFKAIMLVSEIEKKPDKIIKRIIKKIKNKIGMSVMYTPLISFKYDY